MQATVRNTDNTQVPILDGWYPVTEGKCKWGDKFLNMAIFPENGKIIYTSVESDDIGDPWDSFDLLIRKMLDK